MKPACEHIALFVSDLAAMSRFYTRRLGFKLKREVVIGQDMMAEIFGIRMACRMRYLKLRGFGVELFYSPALNLKRRSTRQTGLNHWTILVDDKYAFCGRLERNKTPVIKIEKPHGHTFFIKDPEGNLIEVKSFRKPGKG